MFVHARNATVRTATALRDLAASSGDLSHFQHEQTPRYGAAEKQVMSSLCNVKTLHLTFISLSLLVCVCVCVCVCE